MGRIQEFDSLRGLAALAVLLHHSKIPGFSAGGMGVNLFFVLSGYLITRIIIDRMGEDRFLLNFYARRSLRIWPIYYLALVVLMVINFAIFVPRLSIRGAPYFLAYLQYIPYYWGQPQPSFLHPSWVGHTWTLAIEEQFYLIWPALILIFGRRSIPVISALCITAAYAARSQGFRPELLLTQSDSLALGGLLAWLFASEDRVERFKPAMSFFFGVLAIVSAVLACLIFTGTIDWGVGRVDWDKWQPGTLLIVNLFCTGAVALAALHAGRPQLSPLRHSSLCYLGQISYGFYLYHVPILTTVSGVMLLYLEPGSINLLRFKLLRFGIVFLLTLTTAAASWEWIEKPLLRLKHRFNYSREPDQRLELVEPVING